jgi:hypothetical protein
MKITVNAQTHVESDGRQWVLPDAATLEWDTPRQTYYGGLHELGASLVKRGLVTEEAVQTGEFAEGVVEETADRLTALHDHPVSLTFGSGRFVISRGQGDWVLTNPARDVLRIGKDYVGFCPSIRAALWLAVDRSFKARGGTITYAQLDARLYDLASSLMADVVVSSPEEALVTAAP